jgi:hypothetical protein
MSRSRRSLILLAALLGVWGWLVLFRTPSSGPPAPAGSTLPRPSGTRTPRAQGDAVPRLKTELLQRGLSAYPPEVGSIFGAPPPPPPPPPPPVKVVAPPPPAAAAPPAPPPPPDPFQEEAKRLRYIGFVQAGNTLTAFIGRGPEVFSVEAGQTVADQFRIKAITEEAVLVTDPSGEKQIRLPLASSPGGGPPPGPPRHP